MERLDKFGDVYTYGTAINTGALGALDTTLCLFLSHLRGVTKGDFIEVLPPDYGVLPGHFDAIQI